MQIDIDLNGRPKFVADDVDFIYIKLSPYHREMLYHMTEYFTPKGHDEKRLLDCIRVMCHPDNKL